MLADGVGFEPTRGCPLPVFKTGAFNRSATHPCLGNQSLKTGAWRRQGKLAPDWHPSFPRGPCAVPHQCGARHPAADPAPRRFRCLTGESLATRAMACRPTFRQPFTLFRLERQLYPRLPYLHDQDRPRAAGALSSDSVLFHPDHVSPELRRADKNSPLCEPAHI
jgi:hypothetical protein